MYEEGLLYQSFEKKTEGYYFSVNVPLLDARIRNLECDDTGFNDIRNVVGARKVRFPQLLNQFYGKINGSIAQSIISDTYDPYLRINSPFFFSFLFYTFFILLFFFFFFLTFLLDPSSRCICAHFDADPEYYLSDPNQAW